MLVLGLLLTATTALAGDRVLGYLGVVSGAVIVAVGAGMLVAAIRERRHAHAADPDLIPNPDPNPDPNHDHDPDPDHGPNHPHAHPHGRSRRGGGRLGLAGIGVAGGLVPSPSALVVLLAAIGLGRAPFGVLLVVAYGVGLAAALTAAGLLVLAIQRRATRVKGRLAHLIARLSRIAPLVTAGLVLVVGIGVAARAGTSL